MQQPLKRRARKGKNRMAEYIDREAVISLVTSRYENPELCTQEINSIPAADVVPIVRCLDCKFSREPAKLTKIYGEPGTLTCTQGPCNKRNVSADFFCGYGKKK